MLKNGWLRLWLVSTLALMAVVIAVSAYSVWGTAACYTFVSVSVSDNAQPQDRELAENMKRDATTKTFCGESEYSVALTLEALARRGVVTQVGFQWLEPNGWSFDRSTLDVLKDALNKLSLRGAKRRGNPGMLGESRRWIASLRSQ